MGTTVQLQLQESALCDIRFQRVTRCIVDGIHPGCDMGILITDVAYFYSVPARHRTVPCIYFELPVARSIGFRPGDGCICIDGDEGYPEHAHHGTIQRCLATDCDPGSVGQETPASEPVHQQCLPYSNIGIAGGQSNTVFTIAKHMHLRVDTVLM